MLTAALVLALIGCASDELPPASTCEQAARVASSPVPGDANGDGVADIADGVAVQSALFRGGAPVACLAAADGNADGVLDAGDGVALWYHLFTGSMQLPSLASGACETPKLDEAPCGDGLALGVTPPTAFTGASGTPASADATITLTTGPLDVQAISVSLRTSGCTATAVRFTGAAADRVDDPPGLRDGGFARGDVSADGATAAVVWDLTGDRVAPAGTEASVLTVSLSADVGIACAPCVLTLEDGVVGGGAPVANVAAGGNRAYVPKLVSATVQVCPG